MIVPKDFPELELLAWNRDAARPIERQEAFELYDRNWRHVHAEKLTPHEVALIRELTIEFGSGVGTYTWLCALGTQPERDETAATVANRVATSDCK